MDRVLINSIRNGDDLAFRRSYDLFYEKLYTYFFYKTRSVEISEELVQLTFIKLWRHRGKLNDTLQLSWQVFRIAKTCLIDILRQHAVNRTVPMQAIDDETLMAEPPAQPAEDPQLATLLDSVAQLSPMRRRIIHFRLEGLSNKEIADNLSISKKTVENQINRAVREIKKMHEFIPLVILLLAGTDAC